LDTKSLTRYGCYLFASRSFLSKLGGCIEATINFTEAFFSPPSPAEVHNLRPLGKCVVCCFFIVPCFGQRHFKLAGGPLQECKSAVAPLRSLEDFLHSAISSQLLKFPRLPSKMGVSAGASHIVCSFCLPDALPFVSCRIRRISNVFILFMDLSEGLDQEH
jgi:hypothetical protein